MTKREYMERHGLTIRLANRQDMENAICEWERKCKYIISNGHDEWYAMRGTMDELKTCVLEMTQL